MNVQADNGLNGVGGTEGHQLQSAELASLFYFNSPFPPATMRKSLTKAIKNE